MWTSWQGLGVWGHTPTEHVLDFNCLKCPFLGFSVIQTGYWPVPFPSNEAWQISKLFHLKSISKLYVYIQWMCSKATPLSHVCDMVLSFNSQADKKHFQNLSLETFFSLKKYIPYVMRNVTDFRKTWKPVWIYA